MGYVSKIAPCCNVISQISSNYDKNNHKLIYNIEFIRNIENVYINRHE